IFRHQPHQLVWKLTRMGSFFSLASLLAASRLAANRTAAGDAVGSGAAAGISGAAADRNAARSRVVMGSVRPGGRSLEPGARGTWIDSTASPGASPRCFRRTGRDSTAVQGASVPPGGAAPAGRRQEGREQPLAPRVAGAPLRMPLHAEEERGRGMLDRLDQS